MSDIINRLLVANFVGL